MEAVFIFALGLILGSFLNVCIYRIPRGMSLARPGSFCESCGHSLGALDLAPVISYLLLRGRCRYCGEKFSAENTLVELLTAAALTALYIRLGLSWGFAAKAAFILAMITISFIDFKTGLIPDKLIIAALAAALAARLIELSNNGFLFYACVGLGFGLFLWLISLATKGGIGGGDVKLAAVTAFMLGLKDMFMALSAGLCVAALVYGALIIMKKKTLTDTVPLGSYICLGALAIMLIG